MFILKFIEWLGREKKDSPSMVDEDVAFVVVISALLMLVFIADKVV